MASDLFNVGLGLDTPLPPLAEEHLPVASNIVHGISQDVKVEELYAKDAFQSRVSEPFDFEPQNRELLQPFKLQQSLDKLSDKLKNVNDSDISDFLRNDVTQLLNNNDLLRMYCSLMLN
jgi:hypothetical protein